MSYEAFKNGQRKKISIHIVICTLAILAVNDAVCGCCHNLAHLWEQYNSRDIIIALAVLPVEAIITVLLITVVVAAVVHAVVLVVEVVVVVVMVVVLVE